MAAWDINGIPDHKQAFERVLNKHKEHYKPFIDTALHDMQNATDDAIAASIEDELMVLNRKQRNGTRALSRLYEMGLICRDMVPDGNC